jgi:sigma-B regulation protein RsbU (phosphoserine phosphatase)
MFVTAAVCVLEPATGIFTVANAGHPLPYVRDRAGTVTALGEADGRPLGLDPTVRFTQHRYELDAGDTVVLYTDGVIEALSPDQQVYGDDRLTALMRRAPGDAAGMCRAIDRDVVRYAAGAAQSDDVTILCLTRM